MRAQEHVCTCKRHLYAWKNRRVRMCVGTCENRNVCVPVYQQRGVQAPLKREEGWADSLWNPVIKTEAQERPWGTLSPGHQGAVAQSCMWPSDSPRSFLLPLMPIAHRNPWLYSLRSTRGACWSVSLGGSGAQWPGWSGLVSVRRCWCISPSWASPNPQALGTEDVRSGVQGSCGLKGPELPPKAAVFQWPLVMGNPGAVAGGILRRETPGPALDLGSKAEREKGLEPHAPGCVLACH